MAEKEVEVVYTLSSNEFGKMKTIRENVKLTKKGIKEEKV